MSALNQTAISQLTSVVQTLIPATEEPGLQPLMTLTPTAVSPAGLGGVIALEKNPAREVVARRVSAHIDVLARGSDEAALGRAVSSVATALTSLDRSELLQHGIYKLKLEGLGPRASSSSGDTRVELRELTFSVLYEYIAPPEVSEGVIDEVLVDLEPTLSGPARYALHLGFQQDVLAQFEVVDDPLAESGGPSTWMHNAAELRIEQRSALRGGAASAADPVKAGAYLVHRHVAARDLALTVLTHSERPAGIGVVFRFIDVNNFYFFLMSQQNGFRIFGKKVAGAFATLAEGGRDLTAGFEVGEEHRLKIVAVGDRLNAYFGERAVLAGRDASLAAPGKVGFMSHGNDRAYFRQIKLLTLDSL